MFVGHIGAMDSFARGLRIAAEMKTEGLLSGMVKKRYSTFNSKLGKKVESGKASFEDLEAFVLK